MKKQLELLTYLLPRTATYASENYVLRKLDAIDNSKASQAAKNRIFDRIIKADEHKKDTKGVPLNELEASVLLDILVPPPQSKFPTVMTETDLDYLTNNITDVVTNQTYRHIVSDKDSKMHLPLPLHALEGMRPSEKIETILLGLIDGQTKIHNWTIPTLSKTFDVSKPKAKEIQGALKDYISDIKNQTAPTESAVEIMQVVDSLSKDSGSEYNPHLHELLFVHPYQALMDWYYRTPVRTEETKIEIPESVNKALDEVLKPMNTTSVEVPDFLRGEDYAFD